MRRKASALLGAIALSAVMVGGIPGTAYADPDFGPGSSSKGPQDQGARCHPPGQTTDRNECK